nr:hypothetical protein [Angustibacter aerolatus]
MTTIDAPRTPYRRDRSTRSNFELYSWLFMRGSGVVLIALVFGHLFVNLVAGEGIKGVDFAFVAGKWASPFWQVWDLLMLWLAEPARHERRPHDHQRLRREGPHPHRAQDAAGAQRRPGAGARHAGHLHVRPVPGRRAGRPPAVVLRPLIR